MSSLKPIKLLPARERVASSLRKAIILKEFEQGHELMLDAVAKMLGVSVTPVREAFQILSREGFIQLRPNKGAIVMGITPTFLEDHYEIRESLESEACAIICRKKKDISEIIKVHEDAKESILSGDVSSYSDLNQAFHFAIWNASENARLIEMASNLWNGLSMGDLQTEEQYAQISIQEHEDIMNALIAGDEEQSRKFMLKHIYRSMENVLTRFK